MRLPRARTRVVALSRCIAEKNSGGGFRQRSAGGSAAGLTAATSSSTIYDGAFAPSAEPEVDAVSEFSARPLGLNTPFRSFAQQHTTINDGCQYLW
jgi:hypothetical protein